MPSVTTSRKPFSREDKKAAVELRRAKVPLHAIRKHLQMSKATLKRIVAFAKANPANPVAMRKSGSGRPVPEGPCGVHAQAPAGGDPEKGQLYTILICNTNM